jgi:hypothetical protein
MTAEDAIRFLAHEAQRCRDRDAAEILCLKFPAMLKVLGLPPMTSREAAVFDIDFHHELRDRQRVMTGADFQP